MQRMFRQIVLLLVLFIKQIYKVYRNSSIYFYKKDVIYLLSIDYFTYKR